MFIHNGSVYIFPMESSLRALFGRRGKSSQTNYPIAVLQYDQINNGSKENSNHNNKAARLKLLAKSLF